MCILTLLLFTLSQSHFFLSFSFPQISLYTYTVHTTHRESYTKILYIDILFANVSCCSTISSPPTKLTDLSNVQKSLRNWQHFWLGFFGFAPQTVAGSTIENIYANNFSNEMNEHLCLAFNGSFGWPEEL